MADTPRRIAHFELRGVLGEGGMGLVYRAWDTRLERMVALKILSPDRGQREDSHDRLLREARVASQLAHPHVVAMYEFVEHEGMLCIAMELVEGESLRERLKRGLLPEPEALGIAVQVADAIAAAHRADIVHRDLKPDNVFLGADGRVRVGDFGLARRPNDEPLTKTGDILGTLEYMAPEVLHGDRATAAADVWAFGVMLHEMVVGRRPFEAANARELAGKIADGAWSVARLEAMRLSRPLVELIVDCLRADPLARPASGNELSERLAPLVPGRSMPAAVALAPADLPTPLTTFVGRDREIAELRELVPAQRLVSLLGPGGSGKTRLAVETARSVRDRFSDGTWFVDLSALKSGELAPHAIAAALGVRESAGADVTRQIADRLKPRHALLVLDNVEQVIDHVALLVTGLLAACPSLHLLVTSRERLAVAGERSYPVAPLPNPPENVAPGVNALIAYDAARLFVERAQQAQPGFSVGDADAPLVARICRRLDGIPLALELAAVRVRSLALAQIDERLGDRFRLLTSGERAASGRQQTLRGAIAWSHDLLAPEERILFRRLAVMAGGWELADSERIVSDAALPPEQVLGVLERLLEKSMATIADGLATAPVEATRRYRYLETLREYARERLGEAGETDTFEERHARHFAGIALASREGLAGPDQARWFERCEREHDNLRAALRWALVHDAPLARGMAGMLAAFWSTRGHFEEGRVWLAQALSLPVAAPTVDRVEALLGAGQIARVRAAFDEARDHFAEARESAIALGDDPLLARALNGLGSVSVVRSEFVAAATFYREALALQRRRGDERGMSQALNNLANTMLELGEFEEGETMYEESLRHTRALADERQVAITLHNLGYVALARGDAPAARARLEESRAVFSRLGHREGMARTTMLLGRAALGAGDAAVACRLLEESLEACRKLGNRLAEGQSLLFLGEAALAAGDLPAARSRLAEALALLLEIRGTNDAHDTLFRAVRLLLLEGRPVAAARLAGAVEALRPSLGHPPTPQEAALRDRDRAALDAVLGAEERQRLEGEGESLTVAGARSLAFGEAGKGGAGGSALSAGTRNGA